MSNTSTTDTAFDWSPLGEQRWRELGEAAGCTELQLRFGVARFQGASQTAAARMAGYEGNGDAIRRAGYAAYRSTGVQNLLELAAVHAPESTAITEKEISAKIAKLIRSQDSNVALKAMTLHADRQTAAASVVTEEEPTPEEDARGILGSIFGGLLGVAAMHLGIIQRYGPRLDFKAVPLFKQLAPNIRGEFPEIWARILSRLDADCRAEAEAIGLANPADIAALTAKPEGANAS
jgi:hypothetical protein